MRTCRFRFAGSELYGRVLQDKVSALLAPPWAPTSTATGEPIPLSEVQLLAPCLPSKIVAVGLNYKKHAEEMKKPLPAEPLLFIKPSTAVNGPGEPIVLPRDSEDVQHEGELAIVIGRTLRNASEEEAAAGIFGLTCFNDVTARDIQRREIQHTRSKSYDTFACIGPWIDTSRSPEDLGLVCRVNGQVRQDSRTSDMIFPPAKLLSFISRIMTLLPGDVVITGTPQGVGLGIKPTPVFLRRGDVMTLSAGPLGTQRQQVV